MQMKRLFFILVGCTALTLLSTNTGCKSRKSGSKSAETTDSTAISTTDNTTHKEDNMEQMDNTPTTGIKVKIHTTYGDMTVLLYDETPLHRDNFAKLVKEGYYNDLLFHRCIKGFMVQGGDPNSRNAAPGAQLGVGGPPYKIPAEFNRNLIHKKGALAAARQGDMVNPKKESSGSQFYIVQGSVMNDMQIDQVQRYVQQKDSTFQYSPEQREIYKTIGGTAQLDMDYTVFGEVIEGLNVIDSIASQPTNQANRPNMDIKMTMEIIK
jgi:cyclophilin family peptidyl-prolyl cis-trans isomerase